MIIAGIWARSLGSRVGVCLVIWNRSLVIREGVLICWSLDLICGGGCSVAVHWHNWEHYSDKGVEFDNIGGNLDTWRENFGDLGVDFGTTKFEHLIGGGAAS